MRSSFFGLTVATQGLYTAQASLDVTNHNISNAETKGYSRQYAMVQASRPLPDSARGMVGTGAEVIGISQYRSTYIDNKYWSMTTDLGQYEVKNELIGQLELLFNEPTDNGYNETMGTLFANLQGLSTSPSESGKISNLIDSATAFAEYYNNLSEQISDYQRDANFGVKASVTEINFVAGQLASVNNQIANMELNGGAANDLRDERVRLVDQLSKIINIDAKEVTDVNGKKKFLVAINGQNLVDGNATNFLEVVPRDTLNNPEDQPDLYDVYWQSGKKLYLNNTTASGKLKGYIDVRDGNNTENFKGDVVIPQPLPIIPLTIVIGSVTRHDIPTKGTLTLDNVSVAYDGISYNEGANEMTFTLLASAPAGVTTAQIGESVDFKGIPYYKQQLNEFVRTMAKEFNRIHKLGEGGTGKELFTYKGFTGAPPLTETSDFSYDAINIENFSFSADIIKDNNLLKTSAVAGAGEGANDLLLSMVNIKHDVNLFKKGEPDNFMQSVISEMAIDVKKANGFETGQANLAKLIDNQRQSFSSVDLNEETADMLKYQQAYSLSAKMISVMSDIYDVTIQLVR
ncbi:MAG: flagellar hook-associated protein FlgK [Vallitaleaceae bacterium]|nr:flagellar hook-associated protein FlgK [Vallitaleaceae bacterium]